MGSAGMTHSPIDGDTVVMARKGISFVDIHDDVLGVDLEKGYCYSMNVSGNAIYKLMAEPISISKLCMRIQREFDVDDSTCTRQVLEFITKLSERDLIEICNESL
jgi:Coenzyme PQQ synthesis protein D (PqqD)